MFIISSALGFFDQQPSVSTEFNTKHNTEIKIPGRIVLNLWRVMRKELKLQIYSREHLAWSTVSPQHTTHSPAYP